MLARFGLKGATSRGTICEEGRDDGVFLGGRLEIDCLTFDGLEIDAVLARLETGFMVLALELEAVEGTTEARFAAGFVAATGVTMVSLTNSPCPGAHLKYLWPLTLPSFLPVASGSSIPQNVPGGPSLIAPTYRKMP